MALLKLVHNTEGKVMHPVQPRHAVKVELPQFADNTQRNAHEFLMANFPVLQLPRYQGSVSSVLQCKSCVNTSLSRKRKSCTEVPVPERGVASLETCLQRWLAADEFQDWKCTSCSQRGSGVKKLVLEVYVKLPIDKTVIGSKKYELTGAIYHSGSPMSGHYTAAVKFK